MRTLTGLLMAAVLTLGTVGCGGGDEVCAELGSDDAIQCYGPTEIEQIHQGVTDGGTPDGGYKDPRQPLPCTGCHLPPTSAWADISVKLRDRLRNYRALSGAAAASLGDEEITLTPVR